MSVVCTAPSVRGTVCGGRLFFNSSGPVCFFWLALTSRIRFGVGDAMPEDSYGISRPSHHLQIHRNTKTTESIDQNIITHISTEAILGSLAFRAQGNGKQGER